MWNDSEFNSTFSSPGGNNKEIKKNFIRHIVPVNAQTINLCTQVENENSVYEYGHLRFHQICIVGLIRSVIKRANDITYLVDDMTCGDISVKLQSEDGDDMESEEQIRAPQTQFMENQYVRIYGIIKSLQGQKNVQAFKIIPIKELNEITNHILETINASIYYSTKANGGGDSMDIGLPMGNPLKNSNLNGNMFDNKASNSGLSGIHSQISNLIKQSKSSEGVHLRDICSYLKNIPESKIREALEFLSNEGHVYSTIDDEHFKSTDAC